MPPRDAGLGHELRDDRLTLTFDPPGDAVALCRTWAIERPVAISPDVHQRSWIVHEAGEALPDPYGPRIASSAPTAGPYRLTIELDGRPPGCCRASRRARRRRTTWSSVVGGWCGW